MSSPSLNATEIASYCALQDDQMTSCLGICSNSDVSGPGVRVAFYAQAFFNILLVIHSPEESAACQWASVLLTAAIVMPAIIDKYRGNLTLFHATLILDFATLSTLASFAIAPRCTVWRTTGKSWRRSRAVLSLALLLQITLQWWWAILLFTAPDYNQSVCNASTWVVLFLWPLRGEDIDTQLRPQNFSQFSTKVDALQGLFSIWPIWLCFCMGVTLAYAIILSVMSQSQVYPGSTQGTKRGTRDPSPARVGGAAREPLEEWQTIHGADENARQTTPTELETGRLGAGPRILLNSEPLIEAADEGYGPDTPPETASARTTARRRRKRLAVRFLLFRRWLKEVRRTIWPSESARRWLTIRYLVAFIVSLIFVVTLELQHKLNTMIPRETDWSYGQNAALLLALAPLWALLKMLYEGRRGAREEEDLKEALAHGLSAHEQRRAGLRPGTPESANPDPDPAPPAPAAAPPTPPAQARAAQARFGHSGLGIRLASSSSSSSQYPLMADEEGEDIDLHDIDPYEPPLQHQAQQTQPGAEQELPFLVGWHGRRYSDTAGYSGF